MSREKIKHEEHNPARIIQISQRSERDKVHKGRYYGFSFVTSPALVPEASVVSFVFQMVFQI